LLTDIGEGLVDAVLLIVDDSELGVFKESFDVFELVQLGQGLDDVLVAGTGGLRVLDPLVEDFDLLGVLFDLLCSH